VSLHAGSKYGVGGGTRHLKSHNFKVGQRSVTMYDMPVNRELMHFAIQSCAQADTAIVLVDASAS
jgi:translation elongation factor EF-1alpha